MPVQASLFKLPLSQPHLIQMTLQCNLASKSNPANSAPTPAIDANSDFFMSTLPANLPPTLATGSGSGFTLNETFLPDLEVLFHLLFLQKQ